MRLSKTILSVLALASGVFLAAWTIPARAQCELAKLLADDGEGGDQFGWSVSIWGDTAVIGANYDDDNGGWSGSAFVFRRNDNATPGDPSDDFWVEEAKLLPDDGEAGDQFGQSVAIWGDTAVIGVFADEDHGIHCGSAYVFRFDDSVPPDPTTGFWHQEAKLLASDGAEQDYFGYSVAISGDTAVIGAHQDDDNGDMSGSAYVFCFDASSWVQQAKLLPSDGAALDFFGHAVAISADTAVIGAPGNDDNGSNSGSAYVFEKPEGGWQDTSQETFKLLPDDGAYLDWFGQHVGISADTAVIGASQDDDNGDGSGSAYVFRRTGPIWAQEQKLLASDGEAGDVFGFSVAICADTIVIGAHCDDDNGHWSGSAYVFGYDGLSWVEEAKLLASDGAGGDKFAYSVAICANTTVIGAHLDDDNGADSGSAYVFPACSGDFDFDGYRNVTDFTIFAAAYGSQAGDPNYNPQADLDCDGFVNITDFTIFAGVYLVPCP